MKLLESQAYHEDSNGNILSVNLKGENISYVAFFGRENGPVYPYFTGTSGVSGNELEIKLDASAKDLSVEAFEEAASEIVNIQSQSGNLKTVKCYNARTNNLKLNGSLLESVSDEKFELVNQIFQTALQKNQKLST